MEAFPTAAIGLFGLVSGLLALACHVALEPRVALSGRDLALVRMNADGSPDIITLSKALTGGTLPLAGVAEKDKLTIEFTGLRAINVENMQAAAGSGTDVRKVLDLLMRLEREAKASGGQLVTLLGNHEVMNLIGDWRDVTPEICATFATPKSEARREQVYQDYTRLTAGTTPAAHHHRLRVVSLLVVADHLVEEVERFEQELEVCWEVYNAAWERNWGFVPMSKAEFVHTARDIKPLLNSLCLATIAGLGIWLWLGELVTIGAVATAIGVRQTIVAYATAKKLGWTNVSFIGSSAGFNTAVAKVPEGVASVQAVPSIDVHTRPARGGGGRIHPGPCGRVGTGCQPSRRPYIG